MTAVEHGAVHSHPYLSRRLAIGTPVTIQIEGTVLALAEEALRRELTRIADTYLLQATITVQLQPRGFRS